MVGLLLLGLLLLRTQGPAREELQGRCQVGWRDRREPRMGHARQPRHPHSQSPNRPAALSRLVEAARDG